MQLDANNNPAGSRFQDSSLYESLIFNLGDSSIKKDLVRIAVMFESLPTEGGDVGTIVLKYKKDADTSWTTIFTYNTANEISYSLNSGSGLLPRDYKEIQFQIASTEHAVPTGLYFEQDITDKRV